MSAHSRKPPLPGLLGIVAELVSYRAALELAAAEGGKRLYLPLPDHLKPDHWLVKAIGADGARAVAERCASGTSGIRIVVPHGPAGSRAKQWQTIRRALVDGAGTNDLAHDLGINERTVRRHKAGDSGKGHKPNPKQTWLF